MAPTQTTTREATAPSVVPTDVLITTVLFTSALLHTLYTIHTFTFSLAVISAILSFVNLSLLAIRKPQRPFRYTSFLILVLATVLLVASVFIEQHPSTFPKYYVTQYNSPNSFLPTDHRHLHHQQQQQQQQTEPYNVDSMRVKDLAVAETISLVSRKQQDDEPLVNSTYSHSHSHFQYPGHRRPTLPANSDLQNEYSHTHLESTIPKSHQKRLLAYNNVEHQNNSTLVSTRSSNSVNTVPILARFSESW